MTASNSRVAYPSNPSADEILPVTSQSWEPQDTINPQASSESATTSASGIVGISENTPPASLSRSDRAAAIKRIKRRDPGDFDLPFQRWSPKAVRMFTEQKYGVDLTLEENSQLLRRLSKVGRRNSRLRDR